ncbi:MAG: Crp/Fnr family transcriptional regulator [Zymomonas sp.]|nr:MAG: Crp/Fnr family transcriptional regulator [Zymomonas sp.]
MDKLARYSALSDGTVADLTAATSRSRYVAAGKDLIREGDRPGPVFVILEGWACRYKVLPNGLRQVLAFLMPGDACDLHVGLLAEMDHSIRTISRALVVTIERALMDTMMAEHRDFANAMYVSQLVDEGTMRAWITSMGRRTSEERVAHLMCELYLRARNIGIAAQDGLVLPMSQIILADALGMTPVHLNRVLKKLRLEGAMTLQRGSLTIIKPDKLVDLAGFDESYLHRRLRASA